MNGMNSGIVEKAIDSTTDNQQPLNCTQDEER